MGGYPDLVFVIDTHRESLAIAEAKKIGIPVMAILDSNCNPDNVTYHIPGNDDSIKSIKLYCHLLSEAILSGIKENMSAAGVNLENNKKSANDNNEKVAEKAKDAAEDNTASTADSKKAKAKKDSTAKADKETKAKKAAAPKKAATTKKTAAKKETSSEAKTVKKAAPKKAADKKEK